MLAQLLRFGGVGGAATLTHVLTALAVQAALPVTAQQANLAGFLVAVLVSYTGHARVTFDAPLRSGPQFLRFLFLSLVGLAASSLTVHVMTAVLGLGFAPAMLAVGLIVPGVTYLAMRFWVFAAPRGSGGVVAASDLALCLGLPLALLVVFWNRPVNHDVAWFLFAARDWLAGARLYIDLVEVNPPLNFYLTLPALWLADLLGINDGNGHYVAVALIFLAILGWSAAILRGRFGWSAGRRALVLAGIGLGAMLPSLDGLGQREQVMVLTFLPWALYQAAPQRLGQGQTLASALLAAVGMCLKPHFVLFPLAVTVLNCLEARSLRPVWSLDNLVFAAVGVAYVTFVVLVHPTYLFQTVGMALEVYAAYGKPASEVLSGIAAGLGLAGLTLAIRLRSRPLTRAIRVFVALSSAGLLVYFAQGTGFSYHKLPFLAFTTVACCIALAEAEARRPDLAFALLTVLAIAVAGVQKGFYRNNAVAEITGVVGPVPSLIALSSHVYTGPPVAVALGADWASGYPANWLVPGAMNRLARTDCAGDAALCDRLTAIAAKNRSDVIQAIATRHPDLVIVDRSSGYFDAPEFDWLAFMAEDPAWAPVFAEYRQVAATGRFLLFRRQG